MEPLSHSNHSPNEYPKEDSEEFRLRKFKKVAYNLTKENPLINHFSSSSFFIFDQEDNIKYFNSLSNKNCVKLNKEESDFLQCIHDKIEIQKKLAKKDTLISLDINLYDKIQSYFTIPKKNSDLCRFISKKITSENNRKKITCRKISKAYFEECGQKVSKSTVHNVLKKEMGFRYLKTTLKTNYLLNDIGILNCLCFIKIFIRCIKMNFSPIFIDESKIELENNHFKCWREKDEELYLGNSSKDKRNLLLAVGINRVYYYQITSQNTTAELFIQFLNGVVKRLDEEKETKIFIIMDNLPAHKTRDVFEFLEKNKICTAFNAPYKSIFNAVELAFRAIKRITYSNLYNSIQEAENDITAYLENDNFKHTLLYNYKEKIHQYLLYSEKSSKINMNNLKI